MPKKEETTIYVMDNQLFKVSLWLGFISLILGIAYGYGLYVHNGWVTVFCGIFHYILGIISWILLFDYFDKTKKHQVEKSCENCEKFLKTSKFDYMKKRTIKKLYCEFEINSRKMLNTKPCQCWRFSKEKLRKLEKWLWKENEKRN